jgi:hypothetical protein
MRLKSLLVVIVCLLLVCVCVTFIEDESVENLFTAMAAASGAQGKQNKPYADLLQAGREKQQGPKPYFLVVRTLFQGEPGTSVVEWIDHYLWQGVDHIVMIDSEDYANSVGKYARSSPDYNISSYIGNQSVTLVMDATKNGGNQFHYINKYSSPFIDRTEWLLYVDLDEYVYARKGHCTISNYLRTLNPIVKQVSIPWKVFGSSGIGDVFPSSLTDAYVMREPRKSNSSWTFHELQEADTTGIKSIVRVSAVRQMRIHKHLLKWYMHVVWPPLYHFTRLFGQCISASGAEGMCNTFTSELPASYEWGDIKYPDYSDYALNMNHYYTQSEKYWKAIKLQPGRGFSELHSMQRFYDLDGKCSVLDTELKDAKKPTEIASTMLQLHRVCL